MTNFQIRPRGRFSLAAAQDFAGGFTAGIGGGDVGERSIVMSFPLEDWLSSAAVELEQAPDGLVTATTDAPDEQVARIQAQAERSLSLDHDGAGWPAVGERDPLIARLQAQYDYLRPVCFYSAYEAATSFVLGQRISMRQNARIKQVLRDEHGDRPTVGGVAYPAFPRPERVLDLESPPGVAAHKVSWLHALARAALDGRLDTDALRRMEYSEALAYLRTMPGVGPWTAEATLLRGCGIADELPENDDVTLRAAAALYERPIMTHNDLRSMAERWRPYRMWAVVLLRVGWNRSSGSTSYRAG